MDTSHKFAIELKAGSVRIPLLGQHVSINILLLILCEGSLFLFAYLLFASVYLQTSMTAELLRLEPYLYSFIVVAGITTQGLYRIKLQYNPLGILSRVSLSFAMSFLFIIVLSSVLTLTLSSPLLHGAAVVPAHVLSLFCVLVIHTYFFKHVDQSNLKSNVLVLGAGGKASSIARLKKEHDLRTSNIKGYVRCAGDELRVASQQLVEVDLDDVVSYAFANHIQEILYAPDDRRLQFPAEQLLACKMQGIRVTELWSFFERETAKINVGF